MRCKACDTLLKRTEGRNGEELCRPCLIACGVLDPILEPDEDVKIADEEEVFRGSKRTIQ